MTILIYYAFFGQCLLCSAKHYSLLTVEELIRTNGYPFELYADIQTEDNYLLDVQRIPYGKFNNETSRPVILLMHGLLGSSRNYVAFGPKRGLAFYLADRGYDVWIGNSRGTPDSYKHVTLNPDVDKSYWEFSWHEIGLYDLPAIFNLIRNQTKKDQISYVGHSQGVTAFCVLTSLKPEYNRNVTVMIGLAPQVYMKHYPNMALRLIAAATSPFSEFIKELHWEDFPPKPIPALIASLVPRLCSRKGLIQILCTITFVALDIFNPPQITEDDLAGVAAGFPAVSLRQFLHYAQSINTGEFRQYDFGARDNLNKYGSVLPPSYNLSRVTTPMAIYYSATDQVVNREDLDRLCREVSNCVHNYRVPFPVFKHLDFLFARDVFKLVYDDVFRMLKKYDDNY